MPKFPYFADYGHTSPFPHLPKPALEAPHTHWRPQGKGVHLNSNYFVLVLLFVFLLVSALNCFGFRIIGRIFQLISVFLVQFPSINPTTLFFAANYTFASVFAIFRNFVSPKIAVAPSSGSSNCPTL